MGIFTPAWKGNDLQKALKWLDKGRRSGGDLIEVALKAPLLEVRKAAIDRMETDARIIAAKRLTALQPAGLYALEKIDDVVTRRKVFKDSAERLMRTRTAPEQKALLDSLPEGELRDAVAACLKEPPVSEEESLCSELIRIGQVRSVDAGRAQKLWKRLEKCGDAAIFRKLANEFCGGWVLSDIGDRAAREWLSTALEHAKEDARALSDALCFCADHALLGPNDAQLLETAWERLEHCGDMEALGRLASQRDKAMEALSRRAAAKWLEMLEQSAQRTPAERCDAFLQGSRFPHFSFAEDLKASYDRVMEAAWNGLMDCGDAAVYERLARDLHDANWQLRANEPAARWVALDPDAAQVILEGWAFSSTAKRGALDAITDQARLAQIVRQEHARALKSSMEDDRNFEITDFGLSAYDRITDPEILQQLCGREHIHNWKYVDHEADEDRVSVRYSTYRCSVCGTDRVRTWRL